MHAVVVLLPGHQATEAGIRAHCKSLIASYKSPRSVEFVQTLPMSEAGKILKRELRKQYWDNGENKCRKNVR